MGRTSLPRFVLLAFLSLSAAVSMGQSSQSYLNDTGATAYGVTIPVENGYIDISTGNLHLEFPLAAPPQRGALSLSEKLVYDSRIWLFSPFGTKGSYHWWPTNVYGAPANSAGWRLVTGGETGAVSTVYLSSSTQQCQWAVYGGAITTTIYSIVWTDPRGMAHPFTARSTQVNSTCPYQQVPPSTTISSGQATDGSGYTISGGDANGNPIVLDSSGTQVYPSIIDRFGNLYSADSAGNLIDTTGRVPVITTSNGSTTTYDVLAPNGTINNQGTRVRYTVTTTSISVNTDFVPWQSSDIHQWSGTLNPVQSIALPDGSKYTFGYDADGELNSVSLPTGGSVSYGYANFFDSSNTENRLLTSRTMGSNSSTTITPSVVASCTNYSNGCVEHVTVHKPSGDEMVYELTLNCGAWNTGTTVYTGSAASGRKLLQTTNVNTYTNPCSGTPGYYGANYLSKSLSTTVAFADPSQTQSQAVHAQTQSLFNAIDGKINDVQEWDYLPSSSSFSTSTAPTTTPARETRYTYTGHDLQQVTLLDSKGNQAGQTTYAYTSSATATSGLPQHGSANDVGPYLNTVTHWLNTGGNAVTTYAMYDTGQVKSVSDPDLNPATTFTYQCGGSLPLMVINPLNQSTQYGYDCPSGALTSVQDANDLAAQPQRAGTTYGYEATGGRVQKITQADGGTTTYSYPSSTEVDTAVVATPNPTIMSSNVADVYGRPYQQVVGNSVTDTTYDANGRPSCTTTPHTNGVAATGSTCIASYDGLDRPLMQKQADGNSILTWAYNANVTASTNEAGNIWTRTTDAFGRMTSVVEPGGAQTSYTYDGLGNANTVNQKGVGSEIARNRSFTYDSMSRLITSQSPEAGTICYGTWNKGVCSGGYDLNGNLSYRTDARGQTTVFSYDALNRPTAKSYSGTNLQGASTTTYNYDQASQWGNPLVNTIGRLSSVVVIEPVNTGGPRHDTYAGLYNYDSVGRPTNVIEVLPSEDGGGQSFTLGYDVAGNISSISYPSGRHLTQTFDFAGRLSSVAMDAWQGSPASQTYVSGIQYEASGAVKQMTLGNGVVQTFTHNNRLQICEITATTPALRANGALQTILDKQYFRASAGVACANPASNNGNIFGAIDVLNGNRSQTFQYDALNRLTFAARADNTFNTSYTFDSFGNMKPTDNLHGNPTYSADQNNRMLRNSTDFAYDAAGNMTSSSGNHSFSFDPESRLYQVDGGGTSSSYYDGDGNRIRKEISAGAGVTEYTNFAGLTYEERIAVAGGNNLVDHIFANGQLIAISSTQKPLWHMHAVRDGSINMSCGVEGPVYGVPAGVAGLVLASGDTLAVDVKQTGVASGGGIAFNFNSGGGTGLLTDRTTGTAFYFNNVADGSWHHMVGDLSGYAGQTISYVLAGLHANMPAGTNDTWFANAAIIRGDGTILPIFNGQNVSVGNFSGTQCGGHNLLADTETVGADPAVATSFYVSDHLGTAQLEANLGGWPVWQGNFAPLGQEITQQPTTNNFKFTGLERDNESALDHAMARQYSFITGRWMSPDPYDGSMDFGNPQSFNRYAYVSNNPVTYTDPSGLVKKFPDGSTDWQTLAVEAGGAALTAGISYLVEEGVESLIGLFSHPTFHGSTSSRPNSQPWDEYGSFHPKPYSSAAQILNLGTSGCEFGACGGGFGPGSWSSGAYPNGNDPTDLNLLGGLLDTLNPMRFKRVQCAQQALKKNGVALALDVAGVGAGFLPGGELVVAGAQAGISVASGINSAVTGDAAGAVGSVLGLPAAYAGYGARFLGVGAKAIPGIGSAISALGAFNDGYGTYRDYQTCRARR